MTSIAAIFKGASSPTAIVGSCAMWAWWDLAFYSGIYCSWNDNANSFILPAFIVAMFFSGGTLLFTALRSESLRVRLYDNNRALVACSIAAAITSLGVIAGAAIGSLPLTVVALAACGIELGILEACWGRIWSENGARSAIITASCAITAGIVLDAFMYAALKPLAAALCTCLLPVISTALYIRCSKTTVDSDVFARRGHADHARSEEGSLLRREIFGISIPLIVGLSFCEIAYNFLHFHFIYDPSAMSFEGTAFNLPFLVARATGAAACFLAIGVFKVRYSRFFWSGMLLMSVGFALFPFLYVWNIEPFVCNMINMCCFAIEAIFSIAVFCEISYSRRTDPLETFSFGMIILNAVVAVGMLIGTAVMTLSMEPLQYTMLISIVGYLLIFGLLAVVSEGLRYIDPHTRASRTANAKADAAFNPDNLFKQFAEKTADECMLTAREQDVLVEITRGRGVEAIASRIGISSNTVKTHLRSIYKKTGAHSRQDIAAMYDEWLDERAEGSNQAQTSPSDEQSHAHGPHRKRALDSAIATLSREATLTERETEVFSLLARGYRQKEIQEKLTVSASTVHSHITNIYSKLGVHSYGELSACVKAKSNELRESEPTGASDGENSSQQREATA